MILPFLLLLGPLIGIFLVWNSPEEVGPGHIWFLHLVRLFFLIATIALVLQKLWWMLLLPLIAFVIVELSRKYFVYVALLWLAATELAHWFLIITSLLVSALYLAYMCEKCVAPEKADMGQVLFHARIFLIPLALSFIA